MARRNLLITCALLSLPMAACGGASSASEAVDEDFVESIADVCDNAAEGLEDIGSVDDTESTMTWAKNGNEIFSDIVDELKDLNDVPSAAEDDMDDLVDLSEEVADAFGEISNPAFDDDPLARLFDDIRDAVKKADKRLKSLGVDECRLAKTAAFDAEQVTPTTDPPRTDPPRTDPPRTDPPRTDPPRTDPPQTTVPQTTTPGTDVVLGIAPLEDISFLKMPAGYVMEAADPTIDQIQADVYVASAGLQGMLGGIGTRTILNDQGVAVGQLWVGISTDSVMPESWLNGVCAPTDPVETLDAGGLIKECVASDGNPNASTTFADFGYTFASFDPAISPLLFLGDLLLANG
jgi:hypothetical protein